MAAPAASSPCRRASLGCACYRDAEELTVFRFLLMCALIALGWAFVDVRWQADARVLALRFRDPAEIRQLALARAHELGREWMRAWTEGAENRPGRAVSSPPRGDRSSDVEHLTPDDRRQLNRVVREKLQP
jgi:hypothetical protein